MALNSFYQAQGKNHECRPGQPVAAPIFRLPYELLVTIFTMVAEGISKEMNTHPCMGWAFLMLVCKHWREVGLNTPRLWRTIWVTANPIALRYRLSLSVGCTIDVILGRTAAVNHLGIPLLLPYAAHIRSIRTLSDFDIKELPSIRPLFQVPLPVLEKLNIHQKPSIRRVKELKGKVDLGLCQALLPRVRTFEANRFVVFPSSPDFWSSLSKLKVRLHATASFPMHVDELLAVLASAPQLESLHLTSPSCSLRHFHGRTDAVGARGQRRWGFSLAHLRSVDIEGPPLPFLAPILERIDSPVLSRFYVNTTVPTHMGALQSVSLILPPGIRRIVLRHCSFLSFWCHPMQPQMLISNTPRNGHSDTSNAYRKFCHVWLLVLGPSWRPLLLASALSVLCDTFARAPLEKLKLVGWRNPDLSDLWTSLSKTFPTLRSLGLH